MAQFSSLRKVFSVAPPLSASHPVGNLYARSGRNDGVKKVAYTSMNECNEEISKALMRQSRQLPLEVSCCALQCSDSARSNEEKVAKERELQERLRKAARRMKGASVQV